MVTSLKLSKSCLKSQRKIILLPRFTMYRVSKKHLLGKWSHISLRGVFGTPGRSVLCTFNFKINQHICRWIYLVKNLLFLEYQKLGNKKTNCL